MLVELSEKFLKSAIRDTKGHKDFAFLGNNILPQHFKPEGAFRAKLVENLV